MNDVSDMVGAALVSLLVAVVLVSGLFTGKAAPTAHARSLVQAAIGTSSANATADAAPRAVAVHAAAMH